MISKFDNKGRLYFPKRIRSKMGQEVFIIDMNDEVLIIPVPRDPIKELQEIGKGLPPVSLEELKQSIEDEAYKEMFAGSQ